MFILTKIILIKIRNNGIVCIKQPHCFEQTMALFWQNNRIVLDLYQGKIRLYKDLEFLFKGKD